MKTILPYPFSSFYGNEKHELLSTLFLVSERRISTNNIELPRVKSTASMRNNFAQPMIQTD